MSESNTVAPETFPTSLSRPVFALLLTRSILALILGVLLFIIPTIMGTLLGLTVVIALGVWFIFDGVTSIGTGIAERRHRLSNGWWDIIGGIAAVLAGICALVFPIATAVAGSLLVLWFLAFGLILRGLFEFFAAVGGWSFRLLGVLNIIIGILLVALVLGDPTAALSGLLWFVAVYGVVFGIVGIVTAFAFRKETRTRPAE